MDPGTLRADLDRTIQTTRLSTTSPWPPPPLDFGELRTATEAAIEDPERVDQALWLALHLPCDARHDAHVQYLDDKLTMAPWCGFDLREMFWRLYAAAPIVIRRCHEHQQTHSMFLFEPHHLFDWVCGMLWLCVRERGTLSWPEGYDSLNWFSLVRLKHERLEEWVGLGYRDDEGNDLLGTPEAFLSGLSFHAGSADPDEDEEDAEEYSSPCYRRCRASDGTYWPGVPARLKRMVGVSQRAIEEMDEAWIYIRTQQEAGDALW